MATKEFRDGAEMVGKAAEAKFNDIGGKVSDLKGQFSDYAGQQAVINQEIINRSDDHEERMRQLEENRYFVRSSRRGIEDLDPVQQDRMVGWLQKLVKEFNSRGYAVNRNQQKFLGNLLQFLGITDEVAEVSDLSMMENFGNSEIHEVIYKIFLIFAYLYKNNFDVLNELEDISGLFKLSDRNKADIKRLLEDERIPLLGLDGVIGMYDPSRALNSFKPQTLYANVREIHTHPLLEAAASDETKKLYLQGFALLAGGKNFCEEQYNYIRSLANVLKCVAALEELDQLCVAPQKFQIRKWTEALNTDLLKYAWLLDGTMILGQLPEISKETVQTEVLEEGAKSLRIMQAKDFITPAISLCLSETGHDLYEAIKSIGGKTDGWKHILEYRNLNLNGAFNNILNDLNKLSMETTQISFKSVSLMNVDMNIMSYFDMDMDDGFLDKMKSKAERALVESGRSSQAKKLKEYYNEADSFLDVNLSEIRKGNSILRVFGLEGIYPEIKMSEPDFDNSAQNEDWYDDYSACLEKISNSLDSFSSAATDLVEQLELIEKGDYHVSILAKRKAEQEEKERQAQVEREAKKFVKITTSNGDVRVGIDWQELENLPFNLDDIDETGYAGGNWFVKAKEPYCLDSDMKWSKIEGMPISYISKVFQVNGYLVLFNSSDGMWVSRDCKHWEKASLPTDEDVIGIVFYKGDYVIFTQDRRTYSYKVKGLIFDSQEEGWYYSTIAWKSSSIVNGWEKWNDASYTYEGMVLKSNIACNNNVIVAGFGYDYSFQSDKKKSSDNACVAYFANSRWKDATWPRDSSNSGKFYFLDNHGIFIDTYRPVFISNNGYEWKPLECPTPYKEGEACGNLFITIPNSDGQSLVSLDGQSMTELTVSEKGDWDKFSFGDGMVLGRYAKSKHEASLLLGTIKIVKQ